MSVVDELIRTGHLKTPSIIRAFKKIKRKDFVLPQDQKRVEIDSPLPIGYGQTISQPLTVAFAIELLKPEAGDKILDVGSGSGWTTALLSEVTGQSGGVYGLEIVPELKEFGEKNLAKYNFIKKGVARILLAQGRRGLPEEAPFDKILVSAAAKEVPEELKKELKIGGRMVIPVGEEYRTQNLVLLEKTGENKFKEEVFPGFIFVPLVGR